MMRRSCRSRIELLAELGKEMVGKWTTSWDLETVLWFTFSMTNRSMDGERNGMNGACFRKD